AEQLLGSLAAGRARLLGGDDGAADFARARQLAPGALLVDVMFARGTAVARRDRALFEQTLRGVLAADVTRWPARRADNELARRKAARYLAAADRLFAP
ncbi:MAG TPA: TRAP transporter TatT component family protein, partial [Kofleriaceae bacterium]|nr:TRAP transporter TatT component family protein [Kofleriaceae bacterium]